MRETIGRFSIARECRAYGRLAGLAGVPAFLGRIDAHAFAVAFVPGKTLPEHPRHSLGPALFRRLRALVDAIHARGVPIADLHHRNVLVAADAASASIVDFSLALVRPSSWNLPGRWLYAHAEQLDAHALERIRLRYEAGASAEPAPDDRPRFYAWGRSLKSLSARIRGKRS